MSIKIITSNYKYSVQSPDQIHTVTPEAEETETIENNSSAEQNQAPKSWAQKLNDRRKNFLAGLKLPKQEKQTTIDDVEQITEMDSGEELDRMERGERTPGEGLQGMLKSLKKKFGKKEAGEQEIGEVKSMIEKLKDLSPQDKAKVAMLALTALGLTAASAAFLIPTVVGATFGTAALGTTGTFGTYGFLGLLGTAKTASMGALTIKAGVAAAGSGFLSGGITAGVKAFKKIKNGGKPLTLAEDLQNYKNQIEDIENDDEMSEEEKRQARADLINNRINAKTQKPIGNINNSSAQTEVKSRPTQSLEQANQVSIDHGLEYDDYDAWVQGTKAEIYRKSSNPNNVDLSQFDLSPEAFAQARLQYNQAKVDQLNNTINQSPAAPKDPENSSAVIESVEDLNKDLDLAMDRIAHYSIELNKLKTGKQTPQSRKQITNLENAVLDEQAKIREIETKLPTSKTQPKAPTTISTSPERSNLDSVDSRIQKAIKDGNYDQWEAAMVTKGLNQNPKGQRFDANSFGISRQKFDELVNSKNKTSPIATENIQAPATENSQSKPESMISPEKREEVTKYIEAKIASKYKITTFEQGISNNGELSDQNPTEKMKNAQEIVIGDLHGDIKKFVEHLVLSEMAYLSKDDLEKLYAITENGNDSGSYSDASKMKELSSILSKVQWTGGNREFKLVGDVLSDRNGNDLVMIKYINQLRSKGANIMTLSGNHDHNAFLPNNGVFGGRLHGQANSMLNARESAGFKTQADYFANPEIQKEYLQYAKNLKVFEYNPETQTLIAHAPIFEKTFQQWHKIMVHKKIITESNFDKLDIVDFTEKLNSFYQSYLQELILKGQSGKTMEDYLMNEDTALLFARNGGDNGQSDDLPTFNGQIKVLINGHNTCENSPTSSKGLIGNKEFVNVCLDNSAGKYDDENGNDSPLFLVPDQKQTVQEVITSKTEAQDLENLVNLETITINAKGENLKWNIDIIEDQVFTLDDPKQGDRQFVVVKIRSDSGKESKDQVFYKSTGKNSGSASIWFPCDGSDGIHISKEAYVDGRKSDRFGKSEFRKDNGELYKEISERLGKLNFDSKKIIQFEDLNEELRSILPGIKLAMNHQELYEALEALKNGESTQTTNTTINSAPVAPNQPPVPKKYVAPPPPPKPISQVVQPTNNINSTPQIPNPASIVESQEIDDFDSSIYKLAGERLVKKFFSDKLQKTKISIELTDFTKQNFGYSDDIFKSPNGTQLSENAFGYQIQNNFMKNLENLQSNDFDSFLHEFVRQLQYVIGSGNRSYRSNFMQFLTLARLPKSEQSELLTFIKTYPTNGYKTETENPELGNLIRKIKLNSQMDQYKKAFQDVYASF
jgi:hypothetical protein